MNIFVGNLLFEATEGDVKELFEGFGNVASVVIAMEKEKKAPKSRGFGFVQMPDEQQAFAAIAALNSKEFMGRVLNVNPACPKGQKAMVWPPLAKAETEVKRDKELKDGQVRPFFGQPGTYRGGRRTRSYISRLGLAGMQEEAKPRRRNQDNPMRWRKRKDKLRPWKKAEGESKTWRKSEGGIKPWKKPAGDAKPWKKPAGNAKPWSKSNGRSRTKGRRKPGGHKRRS